MQNSWLTRRLCALAFVAALPAGALAAQDLVLAEVQPASHPLVRAEELFKSVLAERTQNEFNVQIKVGGELGNESQEWQKIRSGAIDITRINLATVANDIPAAKLISLPFLFRSRDHMWRVLGGDLGKRLASELDAQGAVLLGYYDSGSRSFYTTKKPIRSVADFAGQRIRVQDSPVNKDLISLLGGTPVVLPYDKVMDAFKHDEIDGAENNATSYYTSDHYKVAKYYSLDEHSSVPEILLMSKKRWTALNPAQRKAVTEAAGESSALMKKLWGESEAQSLAKAKKEGAVVVDKSQIAMAAVETFAIKLYTKYITKPEDLETILTILRSK